MQSRMRSSSAALRSRRSSSCAPVMVCRKARRLAGLAVPDIYPIENVALFANLPRTQLASLQDAATRHVYKAGEVIFEHGDPPEFLYIIEDGVVDIVLPARGEHITLASFETGSFFGELAVFDSQPRTATARSIGDTSVICIPLAAVASLLDSHPAA